MSTQALLKAGRSLYSTHGTRTTLSRLHTPAMSSSVLVMAWHTLSCHQS